jgi:hypothetical protein
MTNTEEARRRYLWALIPLVLTCVACLCVLLSPLGSPWIMRQSKIVHLQTQLREKQLANHSLHGIDTTVIDAQAGIVTFCRERLPSSYASISERLNAIALEAGVSLSAGRYKTEPSDVPGLAHILVEASVSGSYPNLVKFINATEREKIFFVVDGVSLTEQQGTSVQLQIRIETFLNEDNTA